MDVPSEIRKMPVTSVLLAVSHALLLTTMFALGKASCHVGGGWHTWPGTEAGLLPTASQKVRLADGHADVLRRGSSPS